MEGAKGDPRLVREAAEFKLVNGLFEVHRRNKVRGLIAPAVLQQVANNALRALRDWHETLECEQVVRMREGRRRP